MKTKLLIALLFASISATAQTTFNLNWERGLNGPDMDITIDIGDTVIWTLTDAFPHTVENVVGSSVETFNSGTISGQGTTYMYTFTVEGINDYFCGVHGAANMNGRITVQNNLGVNDFIISGFNIKNNPAHTTLNIELPQTLSVGKITIHDVLGKKLTTRDITSVDNLQLNISTLKKGLYFVTLESSDARVTKRFIKK